MKSKHLITLLPALAIGLSVPAFAANEASAKVESGVAEVRGDAAKAAMASLDAEIDRVDAMIDHAPTQADKAAAKAQMDVLKERRSELRKTYVKARYDELAADVKAQGAKFSAWTKDTFTRSPGEKAVDEINDSAKDAKKAAVRAGDSAYAHATTTGAALDLAAYKARPTDTNKEEAKAAIKALDAKIDQLEDRVDNMPRGADRDALKRRIDALEDRKDELENNFNKARFNALVDDVQGEWNKLVD